MAKKITLEQLYEKLADPDISEEELRPYFELDEEATGAFAPQLEINRKTVTVPRGAEEAARSAQMLNFVNFASRLRRRKDFNRKISSGKYKGPIIVSEGDSWFQYPIKLTDVIDHLSKDYAILSLGAAGDTTQNMIKTAEYMDAIASVDASIFLFSGGGNDLVADGNLASHLKPYDPNLTPVQHLLPTFDRLVESVIQQYDQIIRQVTGRFPAIHIIVHGYDYAIPNNGPWLGKPMISQGIKDTAVQRAITREMMDRFNGALDTLAATVPNVHYKNNRGVVTDTRWYDELHPTDEGYGAVAAGYKTIIKSITAPTPRSRGRSSAARGPKGRSLHIGLNLLDPNHYSGWDGALDSAEFDSEDMEMLASNAGFKTTLLKREDAKRDAVLAEIDKAAKDLKAGDIFLLTYAGHGGQVPDFNGDEENDRSDETWCLFDGQLIDDELAVKWSQFKSGVRVLVIADCCHSGTSIRNMANRTVIPMDAISGLPAGKVREMPAQIAARVARQNRAFYRNISRSLGAIDESLLTRELNNPIACSVRLISGCQDNQVSMDGPGNGAFTAALLATWDDGHFDGNYARFHKEIVARMLPTQTPNHFLIGARDPIFDGQHPFAI